MKRLSVLFAVLMNIFLSACVVTPDVVVEESRPAGFCPPGQAKKGNCTPNEDRGFCPPGQAKKGNC